MHRFTAAVLVALLVTAGCAAKPFPPLRVESFVHNTQAPPLPSAAGRFPQARIHIATAEIDHVLAVRAAVTEEQRRYGLAEVPRLPSDTGLLMVFPEAEHRGGITTQGVQVVLDMAFLDHTGKIVSVFVGNPCRSIPCTVYDPERPYRAVLQLPAGWLSRHHITTGDTVTWEPLPPPS